MPPLPAPLGLAFAERAMGRKEAAGLYAEAQGNPRISKGWVWA